MTDSPTAGGAPFEVDPAQGLRGVVVVRDALAARLLRAPGLGGRHRRVVVDPQVAARLQRA